MMYYTLVGFCGILIGAPLGYLAGAWIGYKKAGEIAEESIRELTEQLLGRLDPANGLEKIDQ